MALDLKSLQTAIAAERQSELDSINSAFDRIVSILDLAFSARGASRFEESRILLNDCLDIECDYTGDCSVLGELAEEWGVDCETDRRKDSPTPTV